MTQETATFLLSVLASINLNVGDPNFDAMAASCQQARSELQTVLLEDLPTTQPTTQPTTLKEVPNV